jgi:hypothetical protein
MLHRVALVRSDVSEELSAFIIKVTRVGELGTTLAVTSNRRPLRRNTRHRRENFKSYKKIQFYFIIFEKVIYTW